MGKVNIVGNVLRFLGFLWLLPMTVLVWAWYILPLWILGEIRLDKVSGWIVYFTLVNLDNWYGKLWKQWLGWSGPCVVIYKKTVPICDEVVLRHEYRHCVQQFVFGCLHYPLYGLLFGLYWIFTDLNPYYDNPFEVDARRYAEENNE